MNTVFRVLVLSFMFAGSGATAGLSDAEKQQICKTMGDLAETTMQFRQSGMSRREMDRVMLRELPEWLHEGARDMASAAWQEPIGSTSSSREEVVRTFSAAVTLDCMLRQFPELREMFGAQEAEKDESESIDGANDSKD